MNLDTILNWLKLPSKYLFVVFLISGILLFAPDSFIKTMGMDLFLNDYRKFIGVVFLGVGSTLMVTFFLWLYSKIDKFLKKRKVFHSRQDRLFELTTEEKKILSGFIFGETRTQTLSVDSGVVAGLVSAKIIYRSAGTIRFPDCAYNIQPWAWDYLRLNPFLLDENF